jgi:F-type H+-transporting ATPase subunit delta
MSQTLTLARPYARAVFSLAREHGRLSQWSGALAFAALAVSEPSVQAVLGNPRLDAQSLVDVLLPPGEADPVFAQFLSVLAENHRLVLLPEIAGLFDAQRAEDEHVVKATITSASELDAAELAKLRDALRKRFGREVEVSTAIDASLIGGAVIDAGDVVIDGSLRTKLARLGAALAN